jgi:hypothetical protein
MAIVAKNLSYGPKRIVTDGLILYLDAGNIDSYSGSGTTWTDLSGNGNNGTLVNGVGYSGGSGGSLVFDGVDDYVGWNSLDDIKWQNWSGITIETVFQLDSYFGATNNRQYLFDYRDNGGLDGVLGCFYDGTSGFRLVYNTVGTSFEEPVITKFSLGTLIYHQVTFDKTTSTNNIRHYINGSNVFNRSVAINSTTTNTGKIWLGRFSGGEYQWNGNIFVHRVYNRALTPQEIQQNYNASRYIIKLLPGGLFGDVLPGRIISYYSWTSASTLSQTNPTNPNATQEATYQERFGDIFPFHESQPLWAICTNTCTLQPPAGEFNHFSINWKLGLVASNGTWHYDDCTINIEFKRADDSTVAAVRLENSGNFTYRHRMLYGPNLSNLTQTATSGTHNTHGMLEATQDGLRYTNYRTSNFNASWQLTCPMSEVVKIKTSGARIQSSWTGASNARIVMTKLPDLPPDPPRPPAEQVNQITSGRIISFVSHTRDGSGVQADNPNATQEPTYQQRYGVLLPYYGGEEYKYRVSGDSFIVDTKKTDEALWGWNINRSRISGPIGTFDYFRTSWTLSLSARNACWDGDYCDADVEFQTEDNQTILAIRTLRDGTYRHGLWYGTSLQNLTKTSQSGSFPNTNGRLTFTDTQATFTNLSSTNFNGSWTLNCAMSQVRKIKLTYVRVQSSWGSGLCNARYILEVVQPST